MSTPAPLAGVRVLEFAGLGPAPFAAMLMADLGADVVRADRAGRFDVVAGEDPLTDGKDVVELDLKDPGGRARALSLVARADVTIEGFRPGTMERLGLGPATCHEVNPALVYVRVDGWGDGGPYADRAGHDINFLAELGILDMIGPAERPVPPVNLIADFGGAGMSAVVGALAALLARGRGGPGVVVRTSLMDGAAYLATMLCGQVAQDSLHERGSNLLDGGHPLYRPYATSDGQWLAVGALEPVFAQRFLETVGLPELLGPITERSQWPVVAARVEQVVGSLPMSHWRRSFADVDACVTPSRTFREAVVSHPFYRVGTHQRPMAPVTFDADRPARLTPERRPGFEEVMSRWA